MIYWKVISEVICCFIGGIVLGGCSSYVTPGRGARMELFEEKMVATQPQAPKVEKPSDITIVERKPTAEFPASIVVVRVQEPGYKSETVEGFGGGSYSVITVRDMEKDEDFEHLGKLGDLKQIAPMSKLLLPSGFQSDKELRSVAARLQADMVLIYTVDTAFLNTDNSTLLSVITLGFGPTVKLRVITTVSALLMDTRTGYIYGMVEETAREETTTAYIPTINACEQLRLKTERKAFEQLVSRFERLWPDIVKQYKPQN